MPALYIGHGAPPLLDDPVWSGELAAWARDLPRPTAILIVSAHWESAPVCLSADGAPLVYDFGGFDPKYYRMTYETPAATALATAGRRDDAGDRAGAPARQPRARPRCVGAAEAHVPRGRHPGPADVAADPRPGAADGARRPAAAAARRGRADHRLGLPDPRAAVPHRVPDRGAGAGLVDRLRRLGRRGAGPRRRRRAGVVPLLGAGDALRAPDRRALHPAVRHAGRRQRPGGARRPGRSTGSGWACPSAACRSPDRHPSG